LPSSFGNAGFLTILTLPEDSSGIHKGELLFLLLLTHFEGRDEFEKCANIVKLRKEFRVKFGTDEMVELEHKNSIEP